MEGVAGLVAGVIAVAALVVAGGAIALVVRADRRLPDGGVGAARQAAHERQLAQIAQRLDVAERELDAGRAAIVSDAVGVARHSGSGRGGAGSRIGLVRFDAFEDAGGGLSFALALIDDDGDGIVLTSLHSRQTTRLYVKDIRAGVADAPLSEEEEQALREAGVFP